LTNYRHYGYPLGTHLEEAAMTYRNATVYFLTERALEGGIRRRYDARYDAPRKDDYMAVGGWAVPDGVASQDATEVAEFYWAKCQNVEGSWKPNVYYDPAQRLWMGERSMMTGDVVEIDDVPYVADVVGFKRTHWAGETSG
jgi:hypothetical protein